jgi:tryptophan-rich sensory protein
MNNTIRLVISIAIPLVIGLAGGFFTAPQIPVWYAQLHKPSWNPPGWIFGPVWTLLYILMGIALFLIWKSDSTGSLRKTAILLFEMQLLLNFCWSFIFFHQHQIGWALAEIALLWVVILCTMFAFGRISSTAAWLMLPYICWVSFAAILNASIWGLNRT